MNSFFEVKSVKSVKKSLSKTIIKLFLIFLIFFLDYIFFSDTMSICQEGQKPPQTQVRPGFYLLTEKQKQKPKTKTRGI